MASQPEISTYDAGVYQLETSDPVQGGVGGIANAPLLNLANRTKWLKGQVDSINTSLAGLATLASPLFTGDPRAPTPANGDNDTSVATTAFVQSTLATTSKDVTGGSPVTLTAAEAGATILDLYGTISANINVIVPASPLRSWIVRNRTTGAYTITVKTAGGTGVVVAQSYSAIVLSDGTNIARAGTDLPNVVLTGSPVATTPSLGDNSTRIATTAYALSAGNTATQVSGSISLTAAQQGFVIVNAASGNVVVTLPPANTLAGICLRYRFIRSDTSGNTVTVQRVGSDLIEGSASFTMSPLERLDIVSDAGSSWVITRTGQFAGTQIFDTAGVFSFTVPNGVTRIEGSIWGAGGGGGGSYQINSGGSAGGGGGFTRGFFTVVPGQTITCTVGAGGAGGTGAPTNGTNGGSSSFGSYASATGGSGGYGGSYGIQTVGGSGGSGTGGSLNMVGVGGGLAVAVPGGVMQGHGGGSAFFGVQNATAVVGGAGIGSNGFMPGFGANGGALGGGGGNGAPGLIILRW